MAAGGRDSPAEHASDGITEAVSGRTDQPSVGAPGRADRGCDDTDRASTGAPGRASDGADHAADRTDAASDRAPDPPSDRTDWAADWTVGVAGSAEGASDRAERASAISCSSPGSESGPVCLARTAPSRTTSRVGFTETWNRSASANCVRTSTRPNSISPSCAAARSNPGTQRHGPQRSAKNPMIIVLARPATRSKFRSVRSTAATTTPRHLATRPGDRTALTHTKRTRPWPRFTRPRGGGGRG